VKGTGVGAPAGQIELHFSTGDAVVERVLRGFIAVCEAAFPDHLRCFVLAGSCAEGTATPLSDLDGEPIFRSDTPLAPVWRGRAALLTGFLPAPEADVSEPA
jgi:hypothetical protein